MDNGKLANILRRAAADIEGAEVDEVGRNPMGVEYFTVEVDGERLVVYVANERGM
jgi:hypothetical protein